MVLVSAAARAGAAVRRLFYYCTVTVRVERQSIEKSSNLLPFFTAWMDGPARVMVLQLCLPAGATVRTTTDDVTTRNKGKSSDLSCVTTCNKLAASTHRLSLGPSAVAFRSIPLYPQDPSLLLGVDAVDKSFCIAAFSTQSSMPLFGK